MGRYYIEINPFKWNCEMFSSDRIKAFWGEKADELTNSSKSNNCNTFIEFNPSKWTKDCFSFDRCSDFLFERMEKNPAFRYATNAVYSVSRPISELPYHKGAEVKFIFDATSNAIEGKTVSDYYTVVDHQFDNNTGYEAFIQRSDSNKTVIITYKDTDDMKDVTESDLPMAMGQAPLQLVNAMKTYRKIAKEYPDYKIIVCGLSLGGSLSELVASSPDAEKHGKTKGYSFNGYGVAGPVLKSCGEGFEDRGNVTAISAKSDRLVGRAARHVGCEYIVDTDFDCFSSDWGCFHHISFMGDEMNKMARNEDVYNKLLYPSININTSVAKYP